MNGRYLLDTNMVIALFANESPVIDRLREAEEVFVPISLQVDGHIHRPPTLRQPTCHACLAPGGHLRPGPPATCACGPSAGRTGRTLVQL
jgi:hypothetical protein